MTCVHLEGNTADVIQTLGTGFVLFTCIPFPLGAWYYPELSGQLLTCALEPGKLTRIAELIIVSADDSLKGTGRLDYGLL